MKEKTYFHKDEFTALKDFSNIHLIKSWHDIDCDSDGR